MKQLGDTRVSSLSKHQVIIFYILISVVNEVFTKTFNKLKVLFILFPFCIYQIFIKIGKRSDIR